MWSGNQQSRPMKNGTYHLIVFALLFAIPVLVVQQQGLGLLSWLASLIPVGYLLAVLVANMDRADSWSARALQCDQLASVAGR